MADEQHPRLREYVDGAIWLADYPIRYAGCRFLARMSVIRLRGGELLVHSPCHIDEGLAAEIGALGEVRFIVAPGNFHHMHVASCQQAFPGAQTYICPGVDRKQPHLAFNGVLGDEAPDGWAGQLDQALIRGSRMMWEVAFFHRDSKTLLLVDVIENIGDRTEGTDRMLRFYWKVMRMWNRALPAPEYRIGWKDKRAAKASFERILAWDFERIIIAHGDLIEDNAKDVARAAWKSILRVK